MLITAKLRSIYGPVRTLEDVLDDLVEQLAGIDAGDPRQDAVRLAIEGRICDVERELLARGGL